ncbi:MAG: hypothetical protein K2P38_18725 [Lachnospiraceae bacterium]|nr:hypothetical protein [Lachnospiraceae bacterium]
MGKINKAMLMLIAMLAIMITAVGIDRAVEYSGTKRWAKERRERYEQARADAAQIQMTISELSKDQQAIEQFIEENQQYFEDMAEEAQKEDFPEPDSFTENDEPGDGLKDDVSGNGVSGNDVSWEDISGNQISGNDISGNDVPGNAVSGNDISGNSVSGNSVSGNDISGNSVSGNSISGNDFPGSTLLEKRKIRGSYAETVLHSRLDQEILQNSQVDFSGTKIACLGDSITAATNLDNLEDYQQYSYPAYLKEILGAKQVENLGIGGSSIGRYWENAFVDRYRDIPEDTDLILVMGGTNDGFCVTGEDFGVMEDRKEGTFIGDLDELIRGLRDHYPDAQVVLVTPLPNVLHDMLRKERDYLLPQSMIANAMKQVGGEYKIPVIDLYNSNILDSHDAAVIYNYMPDGVHCNAEGYQILARHIAAQLVSLYEEQKEDVEEEL